MCVTALCFHGNERKSHRPIGVGAAGLLDNLLLHTLPRLLPLPPTTHTNNSHVFAHTKFNLEDSFNPCLEIRKQETGSS